MWNMKQNRNGTIKQVIYSTYDMFTASVIKIVLIVIHQQMNLDLCIHNHSINLPFVTFEHHSFYHKL